MRICLDAGHTAQKTNLGVCAGHNEAVKMWELHLLVKRELEKYEDVTVHTFRSTINDEVEAPKGYTVNVGRGRKSEGDDLFISLHDNGCDTESVDRAVVIPSIRCNPKKLTSALADKLQAFWKQELHSTQKSQIYNRYNTSDPSWSYYGVLMGAEWVGTPAVIIECSFHSNKNYCKWIMTEGNPGKLAKVIVEAIAETYNLVPKREKRTYEIGGFFVIHQGDRYTNGKLVPSRYVGDVMTIADVMNGAIRLKEINSWVVVANDATTTIPVEEIAAAPKQYNVGDKYIIGDKDVYSNGKKVPASIWGKEMTVGKVADGKILLTEINSWVVVDTVATPQNKSETKQIQVGDKYTIKNGDTYTNGVKVPSRLIGSTFTIEKINDNGYLLSEIKSWIKR